jgi:hypothetical protein
MEVVLHTKELRFIDMGIKQRDSAGFKIALFICIFLLVCVQRVVESITLLVKFHCVVRVDLLVVEIESFILEHWVDFSICFQINWGLICT